MTSVVAAKQPSANKALAIKRTAPVSQRSCGRILCLSLNCFQSILSFSLAYRYKIFFS